MVNAFTNAEHAITDVNGERHLRPYNTIIYAISSASIISIQPRNFVFGKVWEQINFAQESGWQNLEVWGIRFSTEFSILRGLQPELLQYIVSQHLVSRTEHVWNLQRFAKEPHLFGQWIAMPHRDSKEAYAVMKKLD